VQVKVLADDKIFLISAISWGVVVVAVVGFVVV